MASMAMRVQHVDGEYRVVLSAEAMAELKLMPGSRVEITPASVAAPVFEYLSNSEALKIFRQTEDRHREAYQELAK